ncbi:MBL fold metallo-hydrolase [Bacillaceae bacterium S4-13-58]
MTKPIIETEFFNLYGMAEGVYAAVIKPGCGAWSNSGIVDLGDDLLVFDAFSTPTAARELRIQAEKLTGKKVKYLINSHYHGDHTFGNQAFKDTTMLSTMITRKWIEKHNVISDLAKEQEEMKQYLDD